MHRSTRGEAASCPCLIPATERYARELPVGVYCRPGSGRVRVPTADQLAALCTRGRYQECPGYRRWVARRDWQTI